MSPLSPRNDGPAAEGTGDSLVGALWPPRAPEKMVTIPGRDGSRDERTHAALLEEAAAWAAALVERGVSRGVPVGLVTGTDFDFIVACLAIWRAGGVVVPLPGPSRKSSKETWAATTSARLAAAKVEYFVGDPEQLPADVDDVSCHPPRTISRAASSGPLPEVDPEDLGLIQFTSGSTAAPKGIVFRHRTLVARLDRTDDLPNQHHLRLTPLHTGGVAGSLARPLAYGWDLTLIPPGTFLRSPSLWLREVSERHVTHSAAPNYAFALATREISAGRRSFDLSGWEVVICGAGEGADLRIAEEFARVASEVGFRPESLSTHYASTEAGRVTARAPGTGLRVVSADRSAFGEGRVVDKVGSDLRLVSSGTPYPGIEIRIDDGSERAGERCIGEILVRSSDLLDGYVGDPGGLEKVITDGWFRTGDLGFMAEGELFLTGRAKDIIIVHGQNFHASDVEAAAARAGLTGRCAAFSIRAGGSEAVALAVEGEGTDASDISRRVATQVWRTLGITVTDVVVVPPGTLPVTDSGKLKRAEIKRAFEAGELTSTV